MRRVKLVYLSRHFLPFPHSFLVAIAIGAAEYHCYARHLGHGKEVRPLLHM